MESTTFQHKRRRGVLIFNNSTATAMLVAIFIIRPAKEALIALLGNIIGGGIYYFLKFGNYAVIATFVVWILYALISKGRKITKPTYFMLGYVVVLFCSTIRMGTYSLIYLFELLGSGLVLFALFDYIGEKKTIDCIRGIYYCLTIAMVLNSLTIYLFFPNGVYTKNGNSNYYLYALDNVGFLYEIATLALGVIYYVCYDHKIPLRTYLLHVFIMGAYFQSGAATAMIVSMGALIFIATYKIFYKLKIIMIISFKLIIIASVITFVAIVLLQSVSSFSWLFDLVGKDASFSSRVSIWAAALGIWKEHWLLGVGTSADVKTSYLHLGGLSASWGTGIGHLHNVVLEVLFCGGILAMICFLGIILCSYKKMKEENKHIVTKILCVFFFLQWLSVSFDFRIDTYTYWLIPIVMYRVQYLVNFYNQKNMKNPLAELKTQENKYNKKVAHIK